MLHERFNRLAEQICISTITLAELRHDTETSARRLDNLEAIRQFVARLDILAFVAAAAHCGEARAELERTGTPAGAYDMPIAGHARSEGITVVTNKLCEFERMPGTRVEDWV